MGMQELQRTILLTTAMTLAACGKQSEPGVPPAATGAVSAVSAGNAPQVPAVTCDSLPDPKPTDESAAARATAVSQGEAMRVACRNGSSADLARLRELAERQEAERAARKISEEEWRKAVRQGANAPIKQYKY